LRLLDRRVDRGSARGRHYGAIDTGSYGLYLQCTNAQGNATPVSSVTPPDRSAPCRSRGTSSACSGPGRAWRWYPPAAIFPDPWLARIAAAFLPGTGRDPMLHLDKEADAAGFYALTLDDGEVEPPE
jgi:hypothetical protein